MFRKGLGLLFLLLALGSLGVGALIAWRQHGGGSLPTQVGSSLDRVEKEIQATPIGGIRAEYIAGGLVLALVVLSWALLRRRAPAAAASSTGAPAHRRTAERPHQGNLTAWVLAAVVLGLCAGAIGGLYYGPDTIKITESIKIHRGPREEFLGKLKWGILLVAAVHVVYFAVIFLAKVFGSSRQPSRGRSSR